MRKFWQWLGFHLHDWSKWEVTGEIRKNVTRDPNRGVIGVSQERRCETCGLTQYHKQYTV